MGDGWEGGWQKLLDPCNISVLVWMVVELMVLFVIIQEPIKLCLLYFYMYIIFLRPHLFVLVLSSVQKLSIVSS